ncbi:MULTISPECIES: thiol peroxidase [unclassified Campylobacter]|uniref:thiol peroxidase n=1 Tax=unclassified Campylobacter TaxID=2593542 RepID=UPI001237BF81|nr:MULTISPECIES: thiol peroxidase [unclassified Campylobacter]KAA6226358.1 thiol peroxidase [Campylobacter sp. LR286c]KAA6226604.1 thiol peroxidase [Campylobacter sp. LR185c]KAA6226850.1 thiol peroxidase [Campylobacter sp. LR196d]KAA6230287.1 thiol peroxidase [Campylobacter sp. LR291e]KAA8603592.1 lipid hydroperoxide peroxidase [Campylobacter sp. LR185c]
MSVTFKGNAVKLNENAVNVGDSAPKLNLKAKDLSLVEIAPNGKTQIILSLPSLDTAVCATEAREFNQKIASYKSAEVVVVSMDLPFAMGRFCSTENIENLVVASDFLNKEFGKKYGVLLEDSPLEGLLARAVFVIKDGKIAYKEIVSEITNMPNITALDEFFAKNSGCGCH